MMGCFRACGAAISFGAHFRAWWLLGLAQVIFLGFAQVAPRVWTWWLPGSSRLPVLVSCWDLECLTSAIDRRPTQFDRGYGMGCQGFTMDRPTHTPGKSIHISLCANPSHLEAVDPVVEGKTRAKQVLTSV